MAVHHHGRRPGSVRDNRFDAEVHEGRRQTGRQQAYVGSRLKPLTSGKAPPDRPAFQPYWGKPAVRNERGDRGNVGIIRSPVRASILPDSAAAQQALEQIQGTNEDWIWRQYRGLSSNPTVQREIRAFSEAVERKFGYAVTIERVWPQPTPAQRALFGQVQRQLETARVIGRTLAEEKVKVETLVQSLRQRNVPRR